MSRPLRVAVLAGEASGDILGAGLMRALRARHPDVFIRGGIMERGNYSAAAGFGMQTGRQGIFATFSAFLEMLISEITMV